MGRRRDEEGEHGRERKREREVISPSRGRKRGETLLTPLLATEIISVARRCEEREKEREKEALRERKGSPHATPHDGNNFRREKMRVE